MIKAAFDNGVHAALQELGLSKTALMDPGSKRIYYAGVPHIPGPDGSYDPITAITRGARIEAGFMPVDRKTGFDDGRTDLTPNAPAADNTDP